ncbi:hypothetical protein QUF65_19710 [Lysinibacillus sphaericus]|uniref:hypothetical protein n=1 Tax=Lysinibacillus TaxID=400634 RepID=UPI0013B07321|nr:hypothetical protein [Lysinibacillus sphaericus]MDM5353049.1 hypothetical protein [Lysinibacillus sphaericus]MEB7454784.1 hypothetical protein [Lysinibacillus sphaericus]QIC47723.1 hypothetical protein GAG94_11760 [Lysinibacillus sphaericus]
MKKYESLNVDSSFCELEMNELIEVDGGVNRNAIPVIIGIGGVATTLNEGWKFSAAVWEGFKDGFFGKK